MFLLLRYKAFAFLIFFLFIIILEKKLPPPRPEKELPPEVNMNMNRSSGPRPDSFAATKAKSTERVITRVQFTPRSDPVFEGMMTNEIKAFASLLSDPIQEECLTPIVMRERSGRRNAQGPHAPHQPQDEQPVETLKFKQSDKNRNSPRVQYHAQTRDRIHDSMKSSGEFLLSEDTEKNDHRFPRALSPER